MLYCTAYPCVLHINHKSHHSSTDPLSEVARGSNCPLDEVADSFFMTGTGGKIRRTLTGCRCSVSRMTGAGSLDSPCRATKQLLCRALLSSDTGDNGSPDAVERAITARSAPLGDSGGDIPMDAGGSAQLRWPLVTGSGGSADHDDDSRVTSSASHDTSARFPRRTSTTASAPSSLARLTAPPCVRLCTTATSAVSWE